MCAPALEPITYWGNFFICLFCEDDLLFFSFSFVSMPVGWFPPAARRVLSGSNSSVGIFASGLQQNAAEAAEEGEGKVGRLVCVCMCGGCSPPPLPPPTCSASQRSGSWLVFSDDVTVPSADYAWLERTSAAAPLHTPACMWWRHKHTCRQMIIALLMDNKFKFNLFDVM